jgi:hypothetical protein
MDRRTRPAVQRLSAGRRKGSRPIAVERIFRNEGESCSDEGLGLGVMFGVLVGAVAVGCGNQSGGDAPATLPPSTLIVSVEATSVAGLGACPDLGAVGLVTSTADGGISYGLYVCGKHGNSIQWDPIVCGASNAGSVAYVPGSPNELFSCADQSWSMVPLPVGPQGPTGPQGPEGDAGPPGNSVTVTKEPPGANCGSGGEKLQVVDSSGNAVGNPVYVCNGGECTPGQPGFCNGQIAYYGCGSNGQWNTSNCGAWNQTCVAGGCQGNCAQGAAAFCSGQWAYSSCPADGWRTFTDCASQNQTCLAGACQGNCAQGDAAFCQGQVAYTSCSASGQWNTTDCAAQGQTCIGGSCQGVCVGNTSRPCDSGVQGCAGTQACLVYSGQWESQCHATACEPFALAPSPDFGCSSPVCFGASCDESYVYSCPSGTQPTGECDANCVSGCCVDTQSGRVATGAPRRR